MKTTKEIYESEAIDLVAIRIEQLKKKQEEDYLEILKNIRVKFELPPHIDIEITHENRTGFGPEVKIFDHVFEVIYHDRENVTLYSDRMAIRNKLDYGQFISKKKGISIKFDMPDGVPLNEAYSEGKYVHIQVPKAREINENDSKPIFPKNTFTEYGFMAIIKRLIKK